MKNVAVILALSLSFVSTSFAESQCWIWVTSSKSFCPLGNPTYYRTNQYIADTDSTANNSPRRCLQRAAEYKRWCAGSSGRFATVDAAYAYYYVNGRLTIYGAASNDGKTYIYNSSGSYTGRSF